MLGAGRPVPHGTSHSMYVEAAKDIMQLFKAVAVFVLLRGIQGQSCASKKLFFGGCFRLRRRRVQFEQFVPQAVFLNLQHFGQFAGHKAHGLFLQAAFAERKILCAADQQQFAQNFCNNGQIGALEAFGIFTKTPVPVLPRVYDFSGAVAQTFENAPGFFMRVSVRNPTWAALLTEPSA